MSKYEVYGNIGVVLTIDSDTGEIESIMADTSAFGPVTSESGLPLVMVDESGNGDWNTLTGDAVAWPVEIANNASWPHVRFWEQIDG